MLQTTKLTDLRMSAREVRNSARKLTGELASDILYLIFPYLSAAEYLRLTNCTVSYDSHCYQKG